MNPLRFIKAIFTPAGWSVKADLGWEAQGLFEGSAALPLKVVNRNFEKKLPDAACQRQLGAR
jgi:hypothetical protein